MTPSKRRRRRTPRTRRTDAPRLRCNCHFCRMLILAVLTDLSARLLEQAARIEPAWAPELARELWAARILWRAATEAGQQIEPWHAILCPGPAAEEPKP